MRWLDAARYADTNGYQTDGERSMWRWRDWVIDAFNRNMPFDRFTVEQIAGDLLPDATLRPDHRHRLQPQPSRQRRRRHHSGGVRGRVRGRSRGNDVHRVAGPDAGLRALPQPQVRSRSRRKSSTRSSRTSINVPERGKAFKYGNSPPTDRGADGRSRRARLEGARTRSWRRRSSAWPELEPEIATAAARVGGSAPRQPAARLGALARRSRSICRCDGDLEWRDSRAIRRARRNICT